MPANWNHSAHVSNDVASFPGGQVENVIDRAPKSHRLNRTKNTRGIRGLRCFFFHNDR